MAGGQDIRIVTFDLDNTLWDVEPTLLAAEEEQRAWLLANRPGTIEAYDHERLWEFKQTLWKRYPELAHHVSNFRIRMLYELQRQAGYSEEEARSGAEAAFSVFLKRRHAVELYEEALEVLQTLGRDFRLGALTNGNADIYKTDAGEYFDFAFLAEDIGAAKPAPDLFKAALEHTRFSAEQFIHVGDHPEHDIAGARDVGMHTVWVNLGKSAWTGGPRPTEEINRLSDLPAAVYRIAGR